MVSNTVEACLLMAFFVIQAAAVARTINERDVGFVLLCIVFGPFTTIVAICWLIWNGLEWSLNVGKD